VENSRYAFQAAVEAGFSTLETDLRTTSDGVIVLNHDVDTARVASESQLIRDLTFEQLEQINLHDGQRILRLDEFIDEFSDREWIFDIKPETAKDVIDSLVAMVAASNNGSLLIDNARFLFWNRHDQAYFQHRLPGAHVMARQSECYRAGIAALCGLPWAGGMSSGMTYALYARFRGASLFKPGIVERYHRRGARTLAYLPKSERDIEAALEAGIDEIIIDFPYLGR
jgi:glycerophosphoryl diester phosphodiesterase